MMATKTDTREEILRTASRLLQLNGFNGFSYGHIAKELGIKSAAIHYHFPSKSDLGVAVVDRFRTRYRLWMEDGVGLPAIAQLDGFFGIYRRFLERERRACPGGVLQAELDALPEPVRDALEGMVTEVVEWLETVMEVGKREGQLVFDGPANEMAAVIHATVQGALQISRTMGPGPFLASERQLWRLLGCSPEAPHVLISK